MQKRMIIKGRILAIDHGQRRIGMAISDPFRITAQSLPTLTIQNSEELFAVIKNIIQEQHVAEIVVGMPYNLKGEKTASAENVEKFILQLKATFQLPVHQWDERWSTIEAHRTIREMGKSPSRNKEKVDQIAALIILQSFLNYLSNNP
ncbi:Holliday junction resolvase RuvX [candidate division KSB1 bacterium]|nr:Holliday junction resolvase RuvX [candidate division KSB1 bacterium]